ncbi:MAG: protein translocase subunit SecF [Candidatus Pacearchaeota archaeon]|nr:protein translocase subunit SecF [Candidatus Pacearchaeota archaeon]
MEEEQKKNWYELHYKHLLILPIILILASIIYLVQFSAEHGDLILKDVSLTGGTTITVFDEFANINNLRDALSIDFPDLIIRGISNIQTGKQQGFFVETSAEVDQIRTALEEYLSYSLNAENSSIEFSGASLSEGFYQQLKIAILIAFVFMAIVVFLVFRTPIPSLAVIISAFADIIMTLAVINLAGFRLSNAGIIALLMLIGYSVDTDILLTTRLLKTKQGSLNKKMTDTLKTGLTMTLTSIVATATALIIIYNLSDVLRQMFTILIIGLGFDLFNTWITNASILRWYVEAKHI